MRYNQAETEMTMLDIVDKVRFLVGQGDEVAAPACQKRKFPAEGLWPQPISKNTEPVSI